MAIAHITLATRDVERTRDFFAATLLWRPVATPHNVPRDAAWLQIAPNQQLHLLRVDDYQPTPFEREFGRHVAVEYPASEFAALKLRLVEHGATLVAPLRETPFERFFFLDPNGYTFEVLDADRVPE